MFNQYQTAASEGGLVALERKIAADFTWQIVREQSVTLTEDYAALVQNNERTHYFLFRPDQIRIPGFANGARNVVHGMIVGEPPRRFARIGVPDLSVGHIKDWPTKHEAISGSGWKNKQEMLESLSEIYRPRYHRTLQPGDVLVGWRLVVKKVFIFR